MASKLLNVTHMQAAAARVTRLATEADETHLETAGDKVLQGAELKPALEGSTAAERAAVTTVFHDQGEWDLLNVADEVRGVLDEATVIAGSNKRFSLEERGELRVAGRALYELADEIRRDDGLEGVLRRWADLKDANNGTNLFGSFASLARLPSGANWAEARKLVQDDVDGRDKLAFFKDATTQTYGAHIYLEDEGGSRLWVFDSEGRQLALGIWQDFGESVSWRKTEKPAPIALPGPSSAPLRFVYDFRGGFSVEEVPPPGVGSILD